MTSSSNLVLEYKLVSRFESLRQALLDERYQDRWDTPLAHWALPKDRRLPRAFLGRTIKELVNTPFPSLFATPGVGQKKISSLLDLLARAAGTAPSWTEPAVNTLAADSEPACSCKSPIPDDPANIPEVVWNEWRAGVIDSCLGDEPLGRFVTSLEQLPRVIWSTPLSHYAKFSLTEIRSLKTHGEKRVRAVVEVFAALHAVTARAHVIPHLGVRIQPRFAIKIEDWAGETLAVGETPSRDVFRERVVVPLVAQIRADAGEHVAELAESRLGLRDPNDSVRQVARRLGLTRARIYQLLDDVAAIMRVRWPEGRALLTRIAEAIERDGDTATHELAQSTRDLFYPTKLGSHSVPTTATRAHHAPLERPSSPATRRERVMCGV